MVAWVMMGWRRSKMEFWRYFGALLLSKRLFLCQFFLAKVLYFYSRYDFDSFKKYISRIWALERPKEGSQLNFSVLCLTIPTLAQNVGEK